MTPDLINFIPSQFSIKLRLVLVASVIQSDESNVTENDSHTYKRRFHPDTRNTIIQFFQHQRVIVQHEQFN